MIRKGPVPNMESRMRRMSTPLTFSLSVPSPSPIERYTVAVFPDLTSPTSYTVQVNKEKTDHDTVVLRCTARINGSLIGKEYVSLLIRRFKRCTCHEWCDSNPLVAEARYTYNLQQLQTGVHNVVFPIRTPEKRQEVTIPNAPEKQKESKLRLGLGIRDRPEMKAWRDKPLVRNTTIPLPVSSAL